jgi:predicted NUDIX family NTP pyrophosphohydrolase
MVPKSGNRFSEKDHAQKRSESGALNRTKSTRSSAKRSAGILLYRRRDRGIEVLLVHPGGPFWAKKDLGAWSIPKGEYSESEEALTVARREFEEETGTRLDGKFIPLGEAVQAGRKIVTAFALEGDLDPATLRSNAFELEWPPRSGRKQSFPEIDRAQWFAPDAAGERILAGQRPFIARLIAALVASCPNS